MTKDAFEMLTDELTLIRHDMANLQRTSLNKDEAKALSQEVAKGVKQMANAAPAVYEAISSRLDLAIDKIRRETVTAAREATSGAIEKSHAKSIAAARDLAKAAGEARREAWRYFGGFWVWLASVGAAGTILGLLVAFWMTGRGDANQFGQHPGIYCSSAGGQIVTNPEGRRFCAMWIDPPAQAGN
ncbi:MAG: hypothetical protein Q8L76_11880 [Cypionkella sp.]|uniref:hypothetical protein n=1 Tax=Cypionkella sp. TaxID=2811411 RepID=UPI00273212CC|nr:hypothetical protein [Cypionkella sp.]MDP1577441.1 hypothetical protein [Cypionkella sp.]MDP2051951.1 hypothetical protein [Cypionkella sp.]